MDEIKTQETANHWNKRSAERLETMNRSVEGRLGLLDKCNATTARRIAGVPKDRGGNYWKETVEVIRKEGGQEALNIIDIVRDTKGVAEAQREKFYSPEAALENGKLDKDPGVDAQMRLAEQGELRNCDGPGLVRRAEKAAKEGNFAAARLVLGEMRKRGDDLGIDHREHVKSTIAAMEVEVPEIIDKLETNTFELFEKVNQIRYGARRYSYEELGKMDPKEFQEVRRRQREAGISQ